MGGRKARRARPRTRLPHRPPIVAHASAYVSMLAVFRAFPPLPRSPGGGRRWQTDDAPRRWPGRPSSSMPCTKLRSIFSVSAGRCFEVGQRRIAGAEVVEREAHAQRLAAVHDPCTWAMSSRALVSSTSSSSQSGCTAGWRASSADRRPTNSADCSWRAPDVHAHRQVQPRACQRSIWARAASITHCPGPRSAGAPRSPAGTAGREQPALRDAASGSGLRPLDPGRRAC